MRIPVIRRIESALLAIIVFAALAFAPLCQARAQSDAGTTFTVEQSVGKSVLADETSNDVVAPVPTVYRGVGVSKRAEVQGQSWSSWTDKATIGSTSSKGVKAIALELTGLQGLSGNIQYQTHKRNGGWQKVAADGNPTVSVQSIDAIRIKLSGEIARHYDVLYGVYQSGTGWSAWAKNNAKVGSAKKRVLAVRVKLSPKTEEASGKAISTVGVMYEARFKSTGWQTWKRDGKTAGKTNSRLCGFAVNVDAGNVTGGVKYCAYSQAGGWKAWKSNGAYAGTTGNRLEAIKVKLTGNLAKKYDVYYRAYVQGPGWLDWAKNGAEAGSTGYQRNLSAFQIKLVAKNGGTAPADTKYPTLNKLEQTKSMNGIDIASWQAGIKLAKVQADFVIIKATGGTDYVNPYYRQFADAALASGKEIGFYHYAREDYCPGSAAKEAAHFVSKVKPYLGKAALFLDFEGSALNMKSAVTWAKKFMDTVYKKTGVKPLIYMSQSVTWQFNWSSVAKDYKLWVAQYLYSNQYISSYRKSPTHWDIGYWNRETIYQYSSTARLKGYGSYLDVNKFHGSVYSWRKLAQKA